MGASDKRHLQGHPGSLIGTVLREVIPNVPIARLPRIRTLSCTDMPHVPGVRNTTFQANPGMKQSAGAP